MSYSSIKTICIREHTTVGDSNMIDAFINNPKSPKFHVKKYLDSFGDTLNGKTVVDVPAGNGVTSALLLENGAKVEPFDLFPEYFMVKSVECKRADIAKEIPLPDAHADMVICQEGIEHFSDQLKAFKEFNRVLNANGRLLITTPSYSNLAAKFSYLLFESETSKQMPPNEIDDIWMSDKNISSEIYHGHIFLLGLQKLRILGKLAGFRIKEIRYLRLSKGSLLLFPLLYPLIFTSSWIRYFRNLKKRPELPKSYKKKVYGEQLKINTNPKNLLNHHIFIVFEKERDSSNVDFRIDSVVKPFDKIM
ncbi:MAG: class I SAM-dependent methyltransferase [Silvanigrellaceae bacterium]